MMKVEELLKERGELVKLAHSLRVSIKWAEENNQKPIQLDIGKAWPKVSSEFVIEALRKQLDVDTKKLEPINKKLDAIELMLNV